jgi:hypothetical protein
MKDAASLTPVLIKLAETVHPLVLGAGYRAQSQIRMLAKKLLAKRSKGLGSPDDVEKIVSFLCSESGSHDYTIDRGEARDELGLPVDKPDDALYAIINALYKDLEEELELNSRYDPTTVLGSQTSVAYSFHRCIIESEKGGVHVFESEGTLEKQQLPGPANTVQTAIRDNRAFEGWRHKDG